jgi:hypothetical protein
MKNKVSACSNFENTPAILYRKLILTLNVVFKEACDFSSGHFVDEMDQARTHKRSYIFLEESHIIHLRFSQLIVSSKVLKQISAQEMKELKNFHFRENVK